METTARSPEKMVERGHALGIQGRMFKITKMLPECLTPHSDIMHMFQALSPEEITGYSISVPLWSLLTYHKGQECQAHVCSRETSKEKYYKMTTCATFLFPKLPFLLLPVSNTPFPISDIRNIYQAHGMFKGLSPM